MVSIKNAIVGNGMQGLEGVDSWTMSGIAKMTKEPPKSVTLRRVVKVGENNDILETMGNSYDRLSDSIRVYPLGVNPMVAVQFQQTPGSKAQTSLPYKLSSAFRPPIMTLEDTMPLSRQHRKTVEIASNISQSLSTDPFYFHKPLKQSLVVESRFLASVPKAQKEVSTQGYRITLQSRKTVPDRPRVETERVLFENPRIVVLEDDPLRIHQTTNKNAKKISLPPSDTTLVLNKENLRIQTVTAKSSSAGVSSHRPKNFKMSDVITTEAVAAKSSSAGVSSHRPQNFKMADILRIPEHVAVVASDRPNHDVRSEYSRTRDTIKTATRSDLSVERVHELRPEHVLDSKSPIVSVDAVKNGAPASLPVDLPPMRSGIAERGVSLQNFLHNR